MWSENSNNILPEPPEELKHLSEKLVTAIRQKIKLNGPIPFVSVDTAIVRVDEVGQVRAIRPGSTRIRASWGDATSSETVVIVGEEVDPSGISRTGPEQGSPGHGL